MGSRAIDLARELESVSGKISTQLQPFGSFDQLKSLTPEALNQAMKIVKMYQKRLSERTTESIFDVEADRKDFSGSVMDLGLRTVDDIVSKFKSGHIIEVYDANFVQLYHNWVFHYYCSYDLATLITEPVWALYSRPAEINQRIMARAKEIVEMGETSERWDVPTHFLKEVKIRTPRVFKIDFQWISPLVNARGKTVAFVSTNECTPIEITAV
jgi:hypothetical protein